MQLGIVLLAGPLNRLFSRFHKAVLFRKAHGITVFFVALAHSVISFFFLPEHFPRERFFTYGFWPFFFGLIGIALLFFLFCISNQWAMQKIGPERWWRLQQWGARGVFLLVFFHMFVMKWRQWLSWYQTGGSAELRHPEWPGAGLLTGWFLACIIAIRLAEAVHHRLGRAVVIASCILLPALYVLSFWWGSTIDAKPL
ncbi:MAG: ferric reductase-like transmembrane domain-containing protein [Patescibacteria group bacterium]